MEPQDAEFLRQLIDETRALPQQKTPQTFLSALYPIIGAEKKTDQHYDQDMRRKYFLDKANERFPNPSYLPPEISQPLVKYRAGEMSDLDTPYHNEGILTGRNPLAKGFQYFASVPAIALNASQWLGDQIAPGMYPDAGKNLARAVNTATVYGAEDYGLVPRGTGTVYDDYAQEREDRGMVPWSELDPSGAYGAIGSVRQDRIDKSVPASKQHLEASGVPPTVASLWGGVMDTMLDPFNRTGAVLKMARAGVPAATAELAKDYAIGVGLPATSEAIGAAPRVYKSVDDLLNRLHGVE